MKKIPIFLVLGLGVVGWYLWSRGSAAKSIKGLLRKVKFGGSVLKPKIYLTFGIQNASSGAATIKSLVGGLYSNNKLVADVSSFTITQIAPNSETLYQVTAEPVAFGVVSQIIDYVKGKEKKVNFSFSGNLNVDGNSFPLKTSYSL